MWLKEETVNLMTCQARRIERYMEWQKESEEEGFLSLDEKEMEEARYILHAVETAIKVIKGCGNES